MLGVEVSNGNHHGMDVESWLAHSSVLLITLVDWKAFPAPQVAAAMIMPLELEQDNDKDEAIPRQP